MTQQSKNVEAIYPLSPLQEGMLFHSIYAPDSGVYVTQACVTLHGALDVAGFKRAWADVAARHTILRTLFVWEGLPKPHQVVRKQIDLPWTELDWRSLPESEAAARLTDFLASDQTQGFALDQAPLMRFALLRVADDRYHFVWSHHHILMDGWSVPIVMQELLHFYGGAGQPLPRPRPYQDYIRWLQKQEPSQAEAYWRRSLQGFATPTPLPASLTRPRQPHSFAEERFTLAAPITDGLQGLARQHRLTVNSFAQGAWALLLSRYSGEERVLFGAALASRPPELIGIESMVGLFLNNLPVSVQLSPEAKLLDWLQSIQAAQVEREQYAHTPLVDIQGWSEMPRALPLFESHVAFESFPLGDVAEDEQTLEVGQARVTSFTNSAIVVRVIPGDEMAVDLIYDAERFEAAAIHALGEQFVSLLTQFASRPEQTLADFSLLTPAAQQLLPDPRLPLPRPIHSPITALFGRWAEELAEHPAIEWGEQSRSYAALYADARRIAQALIAAGMQKGDVVAVAGQRTYGVIAGMMGVLLSGGVLLTIAHDLPAERQRVMLREADARLLVAVGMDVAGLAFPHPILEVEPETLQIESQAGADLPDLPALTGDDPAYIFFTSGTTGVPKGVLGNHRGLAHFLHWQRESFGVQPTDRCAQLTGLSFDVVMRDIFMPLTSGATLCLPAALAVLEPQRLLAWLNEARITLLHTVPSLAHSWLMQAEDYRNESLRWAFFAGEPLTDSLALNWRAHFLACEVANIYGPTETTLAKFWYHVPRQPLPGVQPVGWPLPQTQALVLDGQDRQCGVGEPGEITIRTPFRTNGYINAPEQNARFVPNPFTAEAGDLLYRTGDRGRYAADGRLEILGRVDDQVKIRGIRIELGEIKALLERHPAVQASVVVAVQGDENGMEPGDKQIVAYVVPAQTAVTDYQTQKPLSKTLHSYLAEQLPEAMIPSAFVSLDEIPLTPNGKVDRRALPAPDSRAASQPGDDFAPPSTEIEESIAAIWRKVLKRETVGIYDNFFAIGGHSLMATQVVGRLRREFDIKFSLHSFFDEPTIAALAELVEVQLLEQMDSELLEELLESV
jgi:surfactin family lipopeptide synthetase C